MVYKIICLLIMLLPMMLFAQFNTEWKLLKDNKMVAMAKDDSVPAITVKHNTDKHLKFVFAAGDTGFVTKIIVMNAQRSGIDTKIVKTDTHEAGFDIQELYNQSGGKDLIFYIVNLPADPQKAALVRVAPHLICRLHWAD